MKRIILAFLLLAVPCFAQSLTEIRGGESFDVKIFEGESCKTFALYKKGQTRVFQRLAISGVRACSTRDFKPRRTETKMYGDQKNVELGDFNFDGLTDLALLDGYNGGYGFPSYQVYLFSRANNKFVLSPSFTELGQYQGMFEVNKNNKMIYNHSKSGCCFHQTEGYRIVNNKPFKVYEFTEEYSPAGEAEVTTKKLVNGRWRTWNRKSAAPVAFARGRSSKTFSVRLTAREPIKWFKFGARKGQILIVRTISPNVDVQIVDADANKISNDEGIIKILEEKGDLVARLNVNGNYYLQVSSERNTTARLTISIK